MEPIYLDFLPSEIIALILTKLSIDNPQFIYLRSLYDIRYVELTLLKYKYMASKLREVTTKYPGMIKSLDYKDLYENIELSSKELIEKYPNMYRQIMRHIKDGILSDVIIISIPYAIKTNENLFSNYETVNAIYIFYIYSLWPHSLNKIKYFPDYAYLPELLYNLYEDISDWDPKDASTQRIFDYITKNHFEGILVITQEVINWIDVIPRTVLVYLLMSDPELQGKVIFVKPIDFMDTSILSLDDRLLYFSSKYFQKHSLYITGLLQVIHDKIRTII